MWETTDVKFAFSFFSRLFLQSACVRACESACAWACAPPAPESRCMHSTEGVSQARGRRGLRRIGSPHVFLTN